MLCKETQRMNGQFFEPSGINPSDLENQPLIHLLITYHVQVAELDSRNKEI